MKLLALCDTPTENTGFACVVRNTLKHWLPHCERIDIWGINYNGWPHEYPYRIYPAGRNWSAVQNLDRLLKHIRDSDYTHLWILQDTFLLSDNDFPKVLRRLCDTKKIRIVLYYPVDAPLENEWLDIVRVADAAATYTQYGANETWRALRPTEPPTVALPIKVIPHGVDTSVFYPLEPAKRWELRTAFFPEWVGETILVNVNRNDRRKALLHSLQVLRELIDAHGPKYKLYLHCRSLNEGEDIDLYQVGERLGLKFGTDWVCPSDADFPRNIGAFTAEQLNELYNAADLCITTTLGEGWGLSITEAAAAGIKVIAPDNTSIPEIEKIVGDHRIELVGLSRTGIVQANDNSRVRYAVDTTRMAQKISTTAINHYSLSARAKEHLNWERIAKEWMDLF